MIFSSIAATVDMVSTSLRSCGNTVTSLFVCTYIGAVAAQSGTAARCRAETRQERHTIMHPRTTRSAKGRGGEFRSSGRCYSVEKAKKVKVQQKLRVVYRRGIPIRTCQRHTCAGVIYVCIVVKVNWDRRTYIPREARKATFSSTRTEPNPYVCNPRRKRCNIPSPAYGGEVDRSALSTYEVCSLLCSVQ